MSKLKCELVAENRSLRAEIAKLRREVRELEGEQARAKKLQAVYDNGKKPATREHRWKAAWEATGPGPAGIINVTCSVCGQSMRDEVLVCPGPRAKKGRKG